MTKNIIKKINLNIEDNIQWDRDFTEKDNIWKDVTDVDYSNKRKKSFKVYINYFKGSILHIFESQCRNKILLYHVVDEELNMKRDPFYKLMTKLEIEKKYNLNF